jgi:hypothetical protein
LQEASLKISDERLVQPTKENMFTLLLAAMDCDYPFVVLNKVEAPRFIEMVTGDVKILIAGILQPAEAV